MLTTIHFRNFCLLVSHKNLKIKVYKTIILHNLKGRDNLEHLAADEETDRQTDRQLSNN